jgi:tetratricopeptide (TPR) repeat protein
MNAKCWFLVLTFSGLFTQFAIGQDTSRSEYWYAKYQDSMSIKAYYGARRCLTKAIKKEEAGTTDTSVLGKYYQKLGEWYYSNTNNIYPLTFLTSGAVYQYLGGNRAGGFQSYSYAMQLYDAIEQEDRWNYQRLADEKDVEDWDTTSLVVKVDSILWKRGNNAYIRIQGGINHGVYDGATGNVLTKYKNGVDRGNTWVGKFTVDSVNRNWSYALFKFYDSKKDLGLLVDDQAEVKTRVNAKIYQGLLYKLASNNIRMKSHKSAPFFHWMFQCQSFKKRTEDFIILSMKDNLTSTYELFKDDTSTVFTEKRVGGRFNGMSILEILRDADTSDIRMFLDYVVNFPYKYIGFEYRFDETFATWAISESPLPDDYKDIFTSKIKQLPYDRAQLKAYGQKNAGYLLGVLENNGEFWTDQLNYIQQIGELDQADSFAQRLIWVSEGIGYDTLHENLIQQQMFIAYAKEDWTRVIDMCNHLIDVGVNTITGYWNRGLAYYMDENYSKSLKDFQALLEYYPESPDVHGMIGWTLMRTGQWKKSEKHVRLGYANSYENLNWTVNLGHLHLLFGEKDSARIRYHEAMSYMDSKDGFEQGILEDFELFLENGWQEDAVLEFQKELKDMWNDGIMATARSREYLALFEHKKDLELYEASIPYIDTAMYYEWQRDTTDYRRRRLFVRWKGYAFYKLKNYDSSLVYYKKGLRISLDHIKDKELLFDDYDDVGNIYDWLDDDYRQQLYIRLSENVKSELDLMSEESTLYWVGIGSSGDEHPFQYAKNDVSATAELVKHEKGWITDTTIVSTVEGNKEEVISGLQELVLAAGANDIFILHLAGEQVGLEGKAGVLIGDDTLSYLQLTGMLNYLQCKKQVFLMDVDRCRFAEVYRQSFTNPLSYYSDDKDIQVLYPHEWRFEDEKKKFGVFSAALKNTLGQSNIHTSLLKPKMEEWLDSMGYPVELAIFTKGGGFELKQEIPAKDSVVPKKVVKKQPKKVEEEENTDNTRGVTVVSEGGYRGKDYALIFAINDYDYWPDLNNAENDARLVRKTLVDFYGFEVELVLNPTKQEVMTKILEYMRKDFGREDQLLIYFAGHGDYDEDLQGKLVCKNTKLSQDDPTYESYLKYYEIVNNINNMRSCRNVFLVMDVCYGGTFFNKQYTNPYFDYARTEADVRNFVRHKRETLTRMFLTSGRKEPVFDGKPGENSPFATKFVQALTERGGSKPVVTLTEIAGYMHYLPSTVKYGTFRPHDPGSDFVFEYKGEDDTKGVPSGEIGTSL